MREVIGLIMNSRNSLENTQHESGTANILSATIQVSGADTIKKMKTSVLSTPEIYKALSSTTYTGKTMKNDDVILMMYNFIRDLEYAGRGELDNLTEKHSSQ